MKQLLGGLGTMNIKDIVDCLPRLSTSVTQVKFTITGAIYYGCM